MYREYKVRYRRIGNKRWFHERMKEWDIKWYIEHGYEVEVEPMTQKEKRFVIFADNSIHYLDDEETEKEVEDVTCDN